MGGEPEWVAEESRPLYHAAPSPWGPNPLVTLVAQSMELLRTAGVAAPDRMRSARSWVPRWTTRVRSGTPP